VLHWARTDSVTICFNPPPGFPIRAPSQSYIVPTNGAVMSQNETTVRDIVATWAREHGDPLAQRGFQVGAEVEAWLPVSALLHRVNACRVALNEGLGDRVVDALCVELAELQAELRRRMGMPAAETPVARINGKPITPSEMRRIITKAMEPHLGRRMVPDDGAIAHLTEKPPHYTPARGEVDDPVPHSISPSFQLRPGEDYEGAQRRLLASSRALAPNESVVGGAVFRDEPVSVSVPDPMQCDFTVWFERDPGRLERKYAGKWLRVRSDGHWGVWLTDPRYSRMVHGDRADGIEGAKAAAERWMASR
jgi:hypothetical protein